MSDLFAALGDWIDSRIKYRGFWYKLGLAVLFIAIIGVFVRDIVDMIGDTE